MKPFRWNLTKRVQKSIDADVIIISIGKSGRTWLRILLKHYFSSTENTNNEIKDAKKNISKNPDIYFTHELWEHRTKANIFNKVVGKYLIPNKILDGKKIIVLYRDPRDTAVSLFHHKTKRSKKRYDKDISSFIRDKTHGIQSIVNVMNKWSKQFSDHKNCLWISYENMKTDTQGALTQIVEFITRCSANRDGISSAVQFGDFKNMKKMEASGSFNTNILSPTNPDDQNSYKVRKGKIGGYKEELSDADIKFVNRAISILDKKFF